MEYRTLGGSGFRVPVMALGTNSFGGRSDRQNAVSIVHAALDQGVTFIDTANVYSRGVSESYIGEAIKGRRDAVVLTTKGGLPIGEGPNDRGASRFHLLRELERSLTRLGTDYVDLYQIHTFDPETPSEETLRTLDDMVQQGKVRYVGASNFQAWEMMKGLAVSERQGWVRYRSMQACYSLVDRTPEIELLPACRDQGVAFLAYYPLAGGILTGKYRAGEPAPQGSRADREPRFARFFKEERLAFAERLTGWARDLGTTSSRLAIAWILRQPGVTTAIVGASRPEQVVENALAAELEIPDALLQELHASSERFRYGLPFAQYRLT